ncbi:hypothetical protein HNH97_00735 [Gluconacetobacter entanii]|nr:hypothetical protein [Gluconacetobacter entanii]
MAKCDNCGAGFSCQPEGQCWCMERTPVLPVPKEGQKGCLCPTCLDAVPAKAGEESADRHS